MSARSLIISHLVVFGAGVYVGKAIDAGELATYREAYESPWAKFRRRAGAAAIGAAAITGLVMVTRMVARSARSNSSV